MKKSKWLGSTIVMVFVASVYADQSTVSIEALSQNVIDVCPDVWEDIKSEIDPAAVSGDVWNGDATDKEDFKTFLADAMGSDAPSAAELESMASDANTVATECATQRVAFFDALLSRLPKDALQAMGSVLDELGVAAEAIEHGGWRVGNIRVTGRPEPAPGWLFLTGQTLGSPSSGAELRGEVLEEVFELAKGWHPNTGNESWSDGDLVILPDMRGRAIVGVNNMGGIPANVLSNPAANQVGGTFGEELHQLTVAELPAHTHSMNSAGNHDHDYTYRGHESGVKSGSGASAWKSSQTEETDNDGSHTHNLSETGGDQPHNIVQPSIVFNVEMKFARGTDGDLTNHAPALGGSQASAAPSCQIIKTAASDSEDGVYWLDVTGGDTSDAFQAYCDMTSEGGGWTMIAAQFEQDPVPDWNEGIQPDYDPTLATSKGFALDTDRLPAHSEIAFGQQFTATYVDYADFVYSTGNIDLQTIVGKKAADEYHVFRSDTHFYHACNADMSLNTDTSGIYVDQLGIEKVGGGGNLDWCFTPAHNLPHWRGRTMLGVQLHQTNETYAWTLWVR